MDFTWRYFVENPEFMTLLNSENLHKARHLQGSKRAREMNSPLIEMLAETDARTLRQFLMNTFDGVGGQGADKSQGSQQKCAQHGRKRGV